MDTTRYTLPGAPCLNRELPLSELATPTLTPAPVYLASLGQPSPMDTDLVVERLADALAATAAERDCAGGHAAHERQLIRDSGLLNLSIPRAYGGLQADWAIIYRSIRRLAEVDSALAHVYAFHHLQMASLLLYGNAEQHQRLFSQTVADKLFWGNALNPLDPSLVATATDSGWRLNGSKSYASGSVGSDWLCLSAHVPGVVSGQSALLIGVVPTRAPGVSVLETWDSFGQRQTDSGTVRLDGVSLPRRDVLLAPDAHTFTRASLRSQMAQLILTHLYLGIARGAFETARRFILEKASPWFTTDLKRAGDDPVLQHRFGQLRLLVRSAELASEVAVADLQRALNAGASLSEQQRGELAVAAAEAKVLAHRAAIEVSSQFFELTGARAAAGSLRLDRFWRNARVHTLHDPVDLKLRDIGRFALDGTLPVPTPYS